MRYRILSHFSEQRLEFNQNLAYEKHLPKQLDIGKPQGLWLSDELGLGWKEWCEDNDFRPEGLAHRTEFEVDTQDLCVLDSDRKILGFHKEYAVPLMPELKEMTVIEWYRVAERFKGVLISPYSWHLRLARGMMWYYGWDCASACIWDLSAVKEISPEKVIPGLKTLDLSQ